MIEECTEARWRDSYITPRYVAQWRTVYRQCGAGKSCDHVCGGVCAVPSDAVDLDPSGCYSDSTVDRGGKGVE
jgi:hypothetical protein